MNQVVEMLEDLKGDLSVRKVQQLQAIMPGTEVAHDLYTVVNCLEAGEVDMAENHIDLIINTL